MRNLFHFQTFKSILKLKKTVNILEEFDDLVMINTLLIYCMYAKY